MGTQFEAWLTIKIQYQHIILKLKLFKIKWLRDKFH